MIKGLNNIKPYIHDPKFWLKIDEIVKDSLVLLYHETPYLVDVQTTVRDELIYRFSVAENFLKSNNDIYFPIDCETEEKKIEHLLKASHQYAYPYYTLVKVLKTITGQLEKRNGINSDDRAKKKNSKKSVAFKDFFSENISTALLQQIQLSFKEETGKNLAIIIYLMEKDFKLISIHYKNHVQSRKNFVQTLKGLQDFERKMYAVNKCFQPNSSELLAQYKLSDEYIYFKNQLNQLISNEKSS